MVQDARGFLSIPKTSTGQIQFPPGALPTAPHPHRLELCRHFLFRPIWHGRLLPLLHHKHPRPPAFHKETWLWSSNPATLPHRPGFSRDVGRSDRCGRGSVIHGCNAGELDGELECLGEGWRCREQESGKLVKMDC